MRVVTVKVKGVQLVNGVWRSRKVLPPDVAAILGKAELTKTTGVAGEKVLTNSAVSRSEFVPRLTF
jgi:hypothetical protein